MSVFETYDRTSRHYDTTRIPVGSEIILGCLARAGALDRQTVLDAGCGTGAYSKAIVGHVGRIVAIDLNAGMLAQAREKLAPEIEAGRVALQRAAITDLPFADGSFDAVMINQVLHHLGDTAEAGFPRLRRVAAEVVRVLRPGGAFVINTCSQAQLHEGHWYHALIPEAAAAFRARFVPLETLQAILEAAGFALRGSFVPVDALCQGDAYLQGRGPLSKPWRDGDSIWALASATELEDALARVRALDAAGDLEAFVARHDARRPLIGQITFVFATRG